MIKRAHVFISGKVQGVFFRASTARQAKKLDLIGFVRNLPDDRVEAVFEGEKDKVEEMIAWCTKGPKAATVQKVALDYESPKGKYTEFEMR